MTRIQKADQAYRNYLRILSGGIISFGGNPAERSISIKLKRRRKYWIRLWAKYSKVEVLFVHP